MRLVRVGKIRQLQWPRNLIARAPRRVLASNSPQYLLEPLVNRRQVLKDRPVVKPFRTGRCRPRNVRYPDRPDASNRE